MAKLSGPSGLSCGSLLNCYTLRFLGQIIQAGNEDPGQ